MGILQRMFGKKKKKTTTKTKIVYVEKGAAPKSGKSAKSAARVAAGKAAWAKKSPQEKAAIKARLKKTRAARAK